MLGPRERGVVGPLLLLHKFRTKFERNRFRGIKTIPWCSSCAKLPGKVAWWCPARDLTFHQIIFKAMCLNFLRIVRCSEVWIILTRFWDFVGVATAEERWPFSEFGWACHYRIDLYFQLAIIELICIFSTDHLADSTEWDILFHHWCPHLRQTFLPVVQKPR